MTAKIVGPRADFVISLSCLDIGDNKIALLSKISCPTVRRILLENHIEPKFQKRGRRTHAKHETWSPATGPLLLCPSHRRANTQGYVPEKVLVIEKDQQRELQPEETVVFIDGNRNNLDIKNLLVLADASEHTTLRNNDLLPGRTCKKPPGRPRGSKNKNKKKPAGRTDDPS